MPGRRLAAATAALVLTGCSDAGDASAAGATVDTVPFQSRLRAASIAPDAMRSLGGPATVESESNQAFSLSDACGHRIYHGPSYRGEHQTFERTWSWAGWWVGVRTHGWTAETGTTMIAAVRSAASECQWYHSDGYEVHIVEVVGVPAMGGVDDRYAQCEMVTPPDADAYPLCRAYLARGGYVSEVLVSREDMATTKRVLPQVAMLAADALTAAA